jgi:Bacterial archaeo-eukaryotic release factor family 3
VKPLLPLLADDGLFYVPALSQNEVRFGEELKGQREPLLLAGVGYLFPIYREASVYPHLLEEGAAGNPDEMKPEELRDRAWEIVGPRFAGARRAAASLYRQLAGTGLTSADAAEVVPAAYYGRVDTLFVAKGLQRWGYFDPRTATAYVHGEPARGDGDLLDLAAVQTFLTGGTVYVSDPEEMPADGPVASVFRY